MSGGHYNPAVSYFLLVYDRRRGRLLRPVAQFGSADREAVLREREALIAERIDDPNIEVVLLSARSVDDLRRTHARYFKTVGELTSVA